MGMVRGTGRQERADPVLWLWGSQVECQVATPRGWPASITIVQLATQHCDEITLTLFLSIARKLVPFRHISRDVWGRRIFVQYGVQDGF